MIAGAQANPDMTRMSIGMEPELTSEIGTKFIAMYTGLTDPQTLEG